jgi:hypothetical protein
VPIEISEFTGTLFRDEAYPDEELDIRDDRFTVAVAHPSCPRRVFTAILQSTDWEFNRNPCFYAGNQQGGPIREVEEPNDSVIEGDFLDYRVESAFDTNFRFSRFVNDKCNPLVIPNN